MLKQQLPCFNGLFALGQDVLRGMVPYLFVAVKSCMSKCVKPCMAKWIDLSGRRGDNQYDSVHSVVRQHRTVWFARRYIEYFVIFIYVEPLVSRIVYVYLFCGHDAHDAVWFQGASSSDSVRVVQVCI